MRISRATAATLRRLKRARPRPGACKGILRAVRGGTGRRDVGIITCWPRGDVPYSVSRRREGHQPDVALALRDREVEALAVRGELGARRRALQVGEPREELRAPAGDRHAPEAGDPLVVDPLVEERP